MSAGKDKVGLYTGFFGRVWLGGGREMVVALTPNIEL